MSEHYISRFSVKDLWGHKKYDLEFHDDVNVIIGPNASGKTTLINILYDSLRCNLSHLSQTNFSSVNISLQSFASGAQRELQIVQSEDEIVVNIDDETWCFPSAQFRDDFIYSEMAIRHTRRRQQHMGVGRLQNQLRRMVPAVWLPVSRRLPIAEEEEMERRRLHRRPLESVDECLSDLSNGLQQYRLSLNAELSELRHEFQRRALENILYDKQHDREFPNVDSFIPPSKADERSLLKAFHDVGLANQQIEARIKDHFAAARDAYSNLKKRNLDIGLVLVLPLINRTRSIVEFAQELESKRERLFSSLHAFEDKVNSFINDKATRVSDQGELRIIPDRPDADAINWRHLSSGEKQILILLTQALLSEKKPVVYVADEPELSLHVTWQEKLLAALTELAGRCQFIVATHSPDIVAKFGNKVIDLSRFQA